MDRSSHTPRSCLSRPVHRHRSAPLGNPWATPVSRPAARTCACGRIIQLRSSHRGTQCLPHDCCRGPTERPRWAVGTASRSHLPTSCSHRWATVAARALAAERFPSEARSHCGPPQEGAASYRTLRGFTVPRHLGYARQPKNRPHLPFRPTIGFPHERHVSMWVEAQPVKSSGSAGLQRPQRRQRATISSPCVSRSTGAPQLRHSGRPVAAGSSA